MSFSAPGEAPTVRFAFADPPYIGQAMKHYGCPEVEHGALVQRLVADYPDGWVLCLSSPTLFQIGDLLSPAAFEHFRSVTHSVEYRCALADTYRDECRIGAWVKPFASFKPGVNPAYAWEPVIFRGGRKRDRTEPTVRDWVSASITLKKGLSGAKPPAFCDWVMDLMGTQEGDEWDDLFPGTGVFGARWKARQLSLGVSA